MKKTATVNFYLRNIKGEFYTGEEPTGWGEPAKAKGFPSQVDIQLQVESFPNHFEEGSQYEILPRLITQTL